MANPCKVLGAVSHLEEFGKGIYLVTFEVPSRFTRYQPGQFLHLTLDEFDPTTGYWPESRVFSIASEPRQGHVTVVYSVKGAYTQRMERELSVGKQVWLKFPYGDFIIGDPLLDAGPVALIAGGTGVSPYRPFLKAQENRRGEVHLFYGVRQAEHLLFRRDFELLLSRPWFHLHLRVEEGGVSGLPYSPGRLSIDGVAHELGTGLGSTNFFLSGPPAMIRQFKADLTARSVENNRIHIDEWE